MEELGVARDRVTFANQIQTGLTISELVEDGWDVGQEKNISHNCSKVNFLTKVQTKGNIV